MFFIETKKNHHKKMLRLLNYCKQLELCIYMLYAVIIFQLFSYILCLSTIFSRISTYNNILDSLVICVINACILFYGLENNIKIVMGLYVCFVSFFTDCMVSVNNGFRIYMDVLVLKYHSVMIRFYFILIGNLYFIELFFFTN
jgi:hypothetical protein